MGARHTDRDLFHQWKEAEARADKWEKKAKEEKEDRKREVTDIVAKFQAEMAEMRGELSCNGSHRGEAYAGVCFFWLLNDS